MTVLDSLQPNSLPDKRNPKVPAAKAGESVFDRLYKTQTASSKTKKPLREQARKMNQGNSTKHRVRPSIPGNKSSATISHRSMGSSTTDGAIFNRLYASGTQSSISKRQGQRDQNHT